MSSTMRSCVFLKKVYWNGCGNAATARPVICEKGVLRREIVLREVVLREVVLRREVVLLRDMAQPRCHLFEGAPYSLHTY